MDNIISGSAVTRIHKAKKIDGVWVPEPEYIEQDQGSNDTTLTHSQHMFGAEADSVYGGLPSNNVATGHVTLKPLVKGSCMSSSGNPNVVTADALVSWNTYVDNSIDPPYYLYHFRLNPPAVTRDIWGASLSLIATAHTYCSLPFSSACTQADDEILDVLYRVEVSVQGLLNGRSNTDKYIENMLYSNEVLKSWIGAPSGVRTSANNAADGTRHYTHSDRDNGSVSAWPATRTIDHNTGVYQDLGTDSHAADSIIGAHIGSIDVFGGASSTPYLYTSSKLKVTSAVQNIFPRSGVSTNPYSDTSAQGLGTGIVSAVDNGWSPPDIRFASCFRVEVISGGASGAATYKLHRKISGPTAGNSWGSQGLLVSSHIPAYVDFFRVPFINATGPDDISMSDIPGLSPHAHATNGPTSQIYKVIVKYVYPEWVTAEATGLTIHDMSRNYEVVNASSAIPLPVTDITQIVHDAIGTLYVACRGTGLWRITRTILGAITDITRVTVPGSVTDTACFGVQMGATDSDLWALLGQEMCMSSDSGATWTVYNESTTPQFLIAGYTSGTYDFQFTGGILRQDTRDPTINRFYIPVPTTPYTSYEGCWWSLEGSATVSDQLRLVVQSSTQAGAYPLLTQQNMYFTAKGTFIASQPSEYQTLVRYYEFGNSSYVFEDYSGNNLGSLCNVAVNVIYADDGTEYIVGTSAQSGGYNYGPVLRNVETREFGQNTYSHTLNANSVGEHPGTGNSNNYSSRGRVHIGKGVFITASHYIDYINVVNAGDTSIATGSGYGPVAYTLGGHEMFNSGFTNQFWESYGWDGASWVLGHAGTRVTSATAEDMLYGAQVVFADTTGTAADYITGEMYDIWMYDGILKDDSTEFSMGDVAVPLYPSVTGNTYSIPVVPATDEVWVDRPIKMFNVNKLTKTGSTSIATSLTNSRAYVGLMGRQVITGDFELKFKYSDLIDTTLTTDWTSGGITNYEGGILGLYPESYINHSGYEGLIYADSMELGVRMWHSQASDGGMEKTIGLVSGGVLVSGYSVFTGLGIDDAYVLSRAGTDLDLTLNGVSVLTASGVSTVPCVVGVPAQLEYDQSAYVRASTCVFSDITLSTTFVGRRYVYMGAPGSGHGLLEDDKFIGSTLQLSSSMTIALDGVPVTILTDPTLPPGVGEMTLMLDGVMWFNSADAGKALSGDWIYSKRIF